MSIGSHVVLVFTLQVAVLLAVALCLSRLAARIGVPSVVAELMTGVLLGPSVLGFVPGHSWLWPNDPAQARMMDAVTQLGVLLFIGIAGAHIDLPLIRRRGRTVVVLGGFAMALPLALGIALGYGLPSQFVGDGADRLRFALLLGVVMAVSAIPVIAKTFIELRMLHRDVGQLTLVAAAVGDVIAWLLLSVVASMAVAGLHGPHLLMGLLYLAGFLLLAALVIRPLAGRALKRAADDEGSGTTISVAVVVILASAAASHALGLEAVLGAFVAGIVLSSSGSAVAAKLAPLRTVVLAVFAPLFLAGAGLKMDLSVLGEPSVVVVAAAVLALAVAGKFAGAYLGARLSRLSHWEGLALGAGLNARGAVEIVVATIGLQIGVLNTTMYTIVVLVAVVTSLMAPPMLRWAMARVEQRAEENLRETEMAVWSDQPAYANRSAQN
ncbi:cation:proton antiporter [Catellatospora vulcania]|uniref:cation:proton antiporter n=1 Tax=Catellatospora vulcania TaxID=1460450 RepID=UPI0012D378F4|nr:cation:proton antiporter [Catellatospora vulcania]